MNFAIILFYLAINNSSLDPIWIDSIITVESTHRTFALSSANCKGLMQLKPSTARYMGYTGHVKGLYIPEVNIHYGIKYIKYLNDKTGNVWVSMDAYNRGYSNVKKYPYKKKLTKHPYVGKILRNYSSFLKEM